MTTLKVNEVSKCSRLASIWGTSFGWEWMVAFGQKEFQVGKAERSRRVDQTRDAGAATVVDA